MQTASASMQRASAASAREPADRSKLVAVGAVAAVGAVLALFADAAPTSWGAVDALYRALLVAGCAVAGSRARRWSLVWGATVTGIAGGGWFHAAALLAFLGAVTMMIGQVRDRVLGAAVGAAIGLAALELVRPDWFTGATAVVASAAILPMLVSAHRRFRRRTRRRIAIGAAAAFAVVLVAAGTSAVFAMSQRTAIDEAVDETSRAVDLLGSDDPEGARRSFERASAQFAEIRAAADAPWLLLGRITPVLGANLGMARTAADVGSELNAAADDLSSSVDQDALRRPDGGIDLAVLASIGDPVTQANEVISTARASISDAESSWLLGPVRDGVDRLTDELDAAADSAATARMAVDRAPDLLGADRPRRYLMLLGNPAEARDLGGHIGTWAELAVVDGRFHLAEVGQPYELADPATGRTLTLDPGAYPRSLLELGPRLHPQNWGGTADFPTVARLAAELYPQVRPGAPLDGVLYADPAAFAALLTFTGPVEVPGTDVRLTSENAAEFLTSGQYTAFGTESQGNDAVRDLVEDVVRRFSSSELPSPRRLVDVLGPLVEEGRLQFESLHEADSPLLERLGLRGDVERPGAGDLLAVLTRNTNPSKIDAFLDRDVTYDVRWDPMTGAIEARLRVRLTNSAPSQGLPPVVAGTIAGRPAGTNRTTLSVLSPLAVEAVTVDDEAASVGTQQELRGVRRHNVVVEIPPGGTTVVEMRLTGMLGARVPYLLRWVGQPAVNPGTAELSVRSVDTEWDDARSSRTFRLDGAEDALLRVPPPWG